MNILIIQGHPDNRRQDHYCHALAQAYSLAARSAGHSVDTLGLAYLDFPMLRNEAQWSEEHAPECILDAQRRIQQADHLVLVFPLWLGTMPALVKAFLEQTLRPDFAFDQGARDGLGKRLLKGKSARVIISMGMPALAFRWFYRGHGYLYLKRNILQFCGVKPVRASLVGLVGSEKRRKIWLEKIARLGAKGG